MPTLYVSTTSPYTRILLMIAHLQNIDLSLEFVTPWDNPDNLTQVNPFSQVPALLWQAGETITETPLIIQAIAPQVYTNNPAHDLPRLAKAFGILSQGVRAFSTERFGVEGQPHPFVARSKGILKEVLPTLPALSADSTEWGDKVLLCALIWIGIRLPECFETLSDDNKQAVEAFSQSELMQKLNSEALANQPKNIQAL